MIQEDDKTFDEIITIARNSVPDGVVRKPQNEADGHTLIHSFSVENTRMF